MLLKGSFEKAHLVADFISREYAFEIVWNGISRVVRIAHHKGTWKLMEFKDGSNVNNLEVRDNFTLETDNRLLLGVTEGIIDSTFRHDNGDLRGKMGQLLAKVIGIWVAPLGDIDEITCFQPGRNSTLDDKGVFSLSPDFKN